MTDPNKQSAKQTAEVDVQALIDAIQNSRSMSDDKLNALLTMMAQKEARIAEKEMQLEIALKARDDQRRRDSENYTISKIEAQKACKHLKGGASRKRSQQRDYNVFAHTFTDGTRVVKCHGCKARWLPGDTDEYLTRNGNKMVNWTGIGWRRAVEMAEDSSNKPSSSERFAAAPTGTMPKSDTGSAVPNLQI